MSNPKFRYSSGRIKHLLKLLSFFCLFVSKRGTRRGTRRISIHPNFIQRFSTSVSGGQAPTPGPSALRVPSDSRPRSGTNNSAETMASPRTEVQTEHASADQVIPQEDSISQIQGHSPRNGEPTCRKDMLGQENLISLNRVTDGF